MNIPWQDPLFRGWYFEGGWYRWKSGLGNRLPPEYIFSWYYNTNDDTYEWNESPVPISKYSVKPKDEYDIKADERAEKAMVRREELDSEAKKELAEKRWLAAEKRGIYADGRELNQVDAEIARDKARWERKHKPKPKAKLTKRQIDNAYAKSKKVHEQEIESK